MFRILFELNTQRAKYSETTVILAYVVDKTLLDLGTKPFGTPRDNCILVAWGYEKQHELIWAKIVYLAAVYVASFVLCLFHSVRQLRLFEELDNDEKTMKDFTLQLHNLPTLSGAEKLEEDIKARDPKPRYGMDRAYP